MKVFDKIKDYDSKIDSTNAHGLKNDAVHMIIVEHAFSLKKSVRSINHQDVIGDDNLFLNVIDQVKNIVTGIDADGLVRISKQQIIALGFTDILTFEEEWLQKVFIRIERNLEIDVELIKAKMRDRILIS